MDHARSTAVPDRTSCCWLEYRDDVQLARWRDTWQVTDGQLRLTESELVE